MRRNRRSIQVLAVVLPSLVAVGTVLGADRFEGLVEPYVEVKIASGVPGILDEVLVQRGDFVQKGQVLARLQSDVEKATADLTRAKAEFAARKAKRNQELAKRQMISSNDRDEIETEAQILQLELKEMEARLKQRTITSPINGVVVKRDHSPGEYVQDNAILELAQIDPLRVEVVIPIKLYGRIKVGMRADVEWEAAVLGQQKAVVKVVDPVVDAASGTIGIRLELPNPRHELPAGTKCWVKFPIAADRSGDKTDPGRPTSQVP